MQMNYVIEILTFVMGTLIASLMLLNVMPLAKLVVGKNAGRKIDGALRAAQHVTFLFVLSDTPVKKHRTGPYK